MNERTAVARRFQFSTRTLLAATAVLALLLVPIVWVSRERERILRARREAIQAVVLAERSRSRLDQRAATGRLDAGQMAARIEQLESENAQLKDTIELQRGEIERLKGRDR